MCVTGNCVTWKVCSNFWFPLVLLTLSRFISNLDELYHPESLSPFYPKVIKYDISSSEGQEMKYPTETVG